MEGLPLPRDHLLVIDQGTTSTRAVVYDAQLKPVGQSQLEVLPTYPQSGWVEHDPYAIINSVGSQVTGALLDAGLKADRIAAIGLTNQRETTIVWERQTGQAIAPALVWQDRRTADTCERLKSHQAEVAQRTGLVIDPYFSATKIAWILDHVTLARKRAEAGDLAAGTVDSFVIWHLTGGRQFVTDATNASRTLLMDLRTIAWSKPLCALFDVPPQILAEIRSSAGEFGATEGLDFLPDGLPIMGVAGDQQASLIGQGCVSAGQAKCTYGTGAFLLAHTGDRIVASQHGLITTLAATLQAVRRNMPLKGACSWQARPSSGSATVSRPSAPRTRLIASPWRQTRRTKSSSSPRSPGWGLLTGSRQPGGRFSGSRVQPQSRTSPRPPSRGCVSGRRPDRGHQRRSRIRSHRHSRRWRHGAVGPVLAISGGSPRSADQPQPLYRVNGTGGGPPGRARSRALAHRHGCDRSASIGRRQNRTVARSSLARPRPNSMAASSRGRDPSRRNVVIGSQRSFVSANRLAVGKRGLGRREPGDRNTERRAGNVVHAHFVAKGDTIGIAAVLAAYSDFQVLRRASRFATCGLW